MKANLASGVALFLSCSVGVWAAPPKDAAGTSGASAAPAKTTTTPPKTTTTPKTGDAKTGDAKTGDAKTGDAKTSDTKPTDAKAGDTKAADAKGGDSGAKTTSSASSPAGSTAKPADSTTKPPTATPAAAPLSPAARALAAKGADYDRIPELLELTGADLEKYKQKLAERNAGYEKWEKTPKGIEYATAWKDVTAARRNGRNSDRATAAEKKAQPLRAEQETVRADLRREFNKQFDLSQLRRIAGDELYDKIFRRFAGSRLSDEQKQQAYVACGVVAAMHVDEKVAESDPYLSPTDKMQTEAIDMIRLTVLRADQKKLQTVEQPRTAPEQGRASQGGQGQRGQGQGGRGQAGPGGRRL